MLIAHQMILQNFCPFSISLPLSLCFGAFGRVRSRWNLTRLIHKAESGTYILHPRKFNSSPLKIGLLPKGFLIWTDHPFFRGEIAVKFRGFSSTKSIILDGSNMPTFRDASIPDWSLFRCFSKRSPPFDTPNKRPTGQYVWHSKVTKIWFN